MKYIVFAVLFFCCFKIFKNSGVDKFIWLMIGMSMINTAYTPIMGSSHYVLLLSYLLSLFFDSHLREDIRLYPLKSASVVIFIIYILIALFSSVYPLWYSLYRSLFEYSLSFLMLFAGFHAVQKVEDYDKILNVLVLVILVSAVYGLICFALKTNPYNDLVGISEIGVDYNVSEAVRGYRIAGFCNTSNPHAHLLTVGSFLLINRKVNKLTITITVLSLANLLLSDSRAPIADLLVLVVTYLVCSKNLARNSIYILLGIIAISLLPSVAKILSHVFTNVIDVFSAEGKNEVQGSSMALRIYQFKSALSYFVERPLFGHGLHYYSEKIFHSGTSNHGLYGMESYILYLMVEYGVIMAIAVIYWYAKIIHTTLVYKDHRYYKIPLALTFTLIAYLLLNRPSDVYEYFLPFIGLGLKLLLLGSGNRREKPQLSTAL